MPGVTTAYQTGVHGSRPANGAGCILYSCTTHGLVYRDDGTSWIDWLTLGSGGYTPGGTDVAVSDGGTGASTASAARTNLGLVIATDVEAHDADLTTIAGLSPSNDDFLQRKAGAWANRTIAQVQSDLGVGGGATVPGWISAFIGTTDATHFYWDGNDLASFTTQTVTGTGTWSEGNNLVSALFTNQTGGDVSAQLIAQTISIGDAWTVAVRVPLASSTTTSGASRMAGILFADGTTSSANCVCGHIQISDTALSFLLVGRHGTLTANSTAPWVSTEQYVGTQWVYIKLIYQASNTFRLMFSPDGVTYSAFGESDISKTMTPTHVGIWGSLEDAVTTSIATFGPLKKV